LVQEVQAEHKETLVQQEDLEQKQVFLVRVYHQQPLLVVRTQAMATEETMPLVAEQEDLVKHLPLLVLLFIMVVAEVLLVVQVTKLLLVVQVV
jgi:hypothetical protein